MPAEGTAMTATAPPDPHPDSPPAGPEETPDQVTPETEPGRENVEDVPGEHVVKHVSHRNARLWIRTFPAAAPVGKKRYRMIWIANAKVVCSFLANADST
jgi:hypothetical protein